VTQQHAHSLLGASGAHRGLNCPGSFQLSETAPPRPASIYAATGTLAHDYIENALGAAVTLGQRPGTCKVDDTELGVTADVEGHTITVDQDLIDGVNVMLDYVQHAAHQSDWVRCEFQVELNDYFLPSEPPPVLLFGRVDVALLDLQTDTLEIIDYKNGSGVFVMVQDNPQLLYYAAGVLRQLPKHQLRRLKRIKLTVVQPNAPGSEPIRSWQITPVDLLMWIDEVLVPGVEACAQDNPPLVPGPWCRFCPAIHACPRLMQDANEMAKRDFADHMLPDDPDELARNLDIAERAQMWINALQGYAVEQLQRQVRIPGWELVPTRPTRKWISDEPTTAGTLQLFDVPDNVIWETRLRSPAQIEKAMGRGARFRELWNGQLAGALVESKSSGVKLARAGKTDAAGDFSDGPD
jgi:hypothetical protein